MRTDDLSFFRGFLKGFFDSEPPPEFRDFAVFFPNTGACQGLSFRWEVESDPATKLRCSAGKPERSDFKAKPIPINGFPRPTSTPREMDTLLMHS